ncbi:MAG: Ig-like domain-containing protein [Candidatus Eiseniibacteriota bacterium]|jgi:hypothetical protein
MRSTPRFTLIRTLATLALGFAITTGITGSPPVGTAADSPPGQGEQRVSARLEPLATNPWYWSYGGEAVVPIGSNLTPGAFQYHSHGQYYDYVGEELDPLAEHLEGHWGILRVALHPGGGQNYAPPAEAPPGGGDWEALAAYERTATGAYDLDRFNEEYWSRLRAYLIAARERHLFAWVELWDTHVYARLANGYPSSGLWSLSPFNPANHRESQPGSLPAEAIDFLESLSDPALHYKQAFVRKLLETTADLGTVLYIHDNENELSQAVREHWARFINDYDPALCFGFSTHRDRGFEPDDDPPHGRPAEETWIEFFDTGFQWKSPEDCNDPRFHAGRVTRVRQVVAHRPATAAQRVPVGATQILAYPWHNLFLGAAAIRFHRGAVGHYADCYDPDETWGELLDTIRVLARFVSSVAVHTTAPDVSGRFTRDHHGALALVDVATRYIVYLEEGGPVEVDLRDATGDMDVRWFDPRSGRFTDGVTRTAGDWERFTPPSPSNQAWILVVEQDGDPGTGDPPGTGSNHAPQVTIDAPVAGAGIKGPIDITVSVDDDGAVAELRIYVDDALLGAAIVEPAPTESVRWDPVAAKMPAGRHEIRAEAIDDLGATSAIDASSRITIEVLGATRAALTLSQNVPNPFNPMTTIEYAIERAGHVTVQIFDTRGSLIRILADGLHGAGVSRLAWDATNQRGEQVASGIYVCRVASDGSAESRKMILMR